MEDYLKQLKEILTRYTNKEAAELLGVSEKTITNYTTGESTPYPKTVRKIAEEHAKLFALKTTNPAPPPDLKDELIAVLREQVTGLKQQIGEKDQALKDLRALLEQQTANSANLEAYFQSLLSLAHTQMDVLLEHRSQMEKADFSKLKKAANTLYDEYHAEMINSGRTDS